MRVARVMLAIGALQLVAGIVIFLSAPALCAGADGGMVVGGFCEAGTAIIGLVVAIFALPQLLAGWALGRALAWGGGAVAVTSGLFAMLYALVLAAGLWGMVTDAPGVTSLMVAAIGLVGVLVYGALLVRARSVPG